MMNKTGVHYTPEFIADFVVEKIRDLVDKKKPRILEPCLGEGVFVKSLHSKLNTTTKPVIEAVEISKATCKKTREYFNTQLLSRVNNIDYLSFNTKKRYDLIIGNPPYVNMRHMTKHQLNLCSTLSQSMNEMGYAASLKNLWTAFIVKSFSLLSDDGVIAFILPSDLAHVTHANPIKDYLKNQFSRIELYEFNDMVFDDVEQNVVLMVAIKSHKKLNQGIFHSTINVTDNIIKEKKIKRLNSLVPNKWTNHGLTNSEINLLKGLHRKLYPVKEFCESYAGIVTAANNYFILNKDKINEYGLKSYATPVIQKAAYVNGSVTFEEKDWMTLRQSNSPCYLLDFSKHNKITSEAQKYLLAGVNNKINDRYKCKQRENWYKVPNISASEGFFFKRSHLYPKLIKNDIEVCVTDTAYSINMLNNYNLNSLIYSFYNSLSLVFSEILGRKYAGGVLELTPSEFKNIPIPYMDISNSEFTEFKNRFSKKNSIYDIALKNDEEILCDGLGLTKTDVKKIHNMYKKLLSIRLNRNNQIFLSNPSTHHSL